MMQEQFSRALLAPDLPVPDGLTRPDGRGAGRRFDIYRNNVVTSCVEAAKTGFPAVAHLLGDDFFSALSAAYIRAHPPRSRRMALFGADLPEFLDRFPPVAHLPYLADVARLELALRAAYHAADAQPLAVSALADWPADRLMAARATLAPAIRVVTSPFPVLGLWAMAQDGPLPEPVPQEVVVLRPAFDPEARLLPPRGGRMVRSLQAGASLAVAADVLDSDATHAVMAMLLSNKALISLEGGDHDGTDHPAA